MTAAVGIAQSGTNNVSWRNRIINGAMVIDQRNAGASVTPTAGVYTLDRWYADVSASSKYSLQRNAGSVTPPAGFTNYLGVTSLAATSLAASDYYYLFQGIEGFNVADLGWGAAGAQTVTLSFWVRSSLTGTFGGSLKNGSNNRSYPFTYTISAANTWEYETITIPGDTSGTWLTTNGMGIGVHFGLGVGSTYSGTAGTWAGSNFLSATGATSVVGTNGATFYITGVQLERGTSATPFEYRDYGSELLMCYRYCFAETNENAAYRWFGQGYTTSTTAASIGRPLPVTMRTSPTATIVNPTGFIVDRSSGAAAVTSITLWFTTATYVRYEAISSGLTANTPCAVGSDGSSSLRAIIYTAEF